MTFVRTCEFLISRLRRGVSLLQLGWAGAVSEVLLPCRVTCPNDVSGVVGHYGSVFAPGRLSNSRIQSSLIGDTTWLGCNV